MTLSDRRALGRSSLGESVHRRSPNSNRPWAWKTEIAQGVNNERREKFGRVAGERGRMHAKLQSSRAYSMVEFTPSLTRRVSGPRFPAHGMQRGKSAANRAAVGPGDGSGPCSGGGGDAEARRSDADKIGDRRQQHPLISST